MSRLMRMLMAQNGYMEPVGDSDSAGMGSKGMGDQENDQTGGKDNGEESKGEQKGEESKGEQKGEESNDNADDAKKKEQIDDKTASLVKEMMKWKEKARTNESEKSKLAGQLSELLGDDMTIDDVKDIIKSQKDAEVKELERKGEYTRIVEQMKEENQKEIGKISDNLNAVKEENQALKNKIEELTVGRAFSDSNFIRDNSQLPPSIARKEFSDYVDFVDGEIVVFNKPKGAEGRTPLVDANGANKSFDAGIEQLFLAHPESKSILRSKRKPGAGSISESTGKHVDARPPKTAADKIASGLSKLSGKEIR